MSKKDNLAHHLYELRIALIKCFLIIFSGSVACWYFSDFLFDLIRNPISEHLRSKGLIYTGVTDKFLAHMKVALLGGIIFTCPLWLFQVWKFISPGLYKTEKKMTLFFVSFGTSLFLFGILFVYFVIYPLAFNFLLNFGDGADMPMITINKYLSFFMTTTLMFGLAFELPLVLVILNMLGIVNTNFLKKYRGYAYVILATISAFITPPDVVSMLFFMLPMILLYEISIALVYYIPRIFGIP